MQLFDPSPPSLVTETSEPSLSDSQQAVAPDEAGDLRLTDLSFVRTIDKTYTDPLSLIWIHAAAQMGMRIERSAEVNASWNGRGTLTLGTPETLDPDDCLAQMILHEVCHALCEGPESIDRPDWGLDNLGRGGRVREHACLRLQAALADLYGMRSMFAATTMFRPYYDNLPADPLEDGDEETTSLAKAAWQRANHGPWAGPLHDALRRTALIAQALRGITAEDSIWHVPASAVELRKDAPEPLRG